MAFAENLNALMAMNEITNYRLAQILGVSQTSVANWREGKNAPHKKTKTAIAELFGITAEELSSDGFTVQPGSTRFTHSIGTTDLARQLLKQMEKPTPVSEGGQHINIVRIAGRDGRLVEKRLTDDQIKALQTIIDQMPEAPEDL